MERIWIVWTCAAGLASKSVALQYARPDFLRDCPVQDRAAFRGQKHVLARFEARTILVCENIVALFVPELAHAARPLRNSTARLTQFGTADYAIEVFEQEQTD